MGTSRTIRLTVLLVVIGLAPSLLTASAGAAQPGNIEPTGHGNGTLTFGQLAPQTGRLSNVVQSLTAPVTMAVEEINGAGGVLGQPVGYSLADDGTNPDVAVASLEQLLEAGGADAIMGPATSGTMLGILDDVRAAKALDCSGSNTSIFLSTANSGGYYFRTAPPDSLQGPALAKLVVRDEHKKVAILARRDEYGATLAKGVAAGVRRGGAKVVADVKYDPNSHDFYRDVRKVSRADPDSVVVLGFDTDGADVVRTLIAKFLAPPNVAVYVTDAMRTDTFGQLVDPNNSGVVAGIKGTAAAVAPAGVQNPFIQKFAATGIDPIFSAHYYDCAILTALAAEKAKSDAPDKMKQAFAANTRGTVKCNTFADCKKALDEKKTIQYEGASASFKNMNEFGKFQPNAGVFEVWSFDAGAKDVTAPPESQIRIG
jgi:ABC-type branched-subunit amino acid transport system substrate-binding protein